MQCIVVGNSSPPSLVQSSIGIDICTKNPFPSGVTFALSFEPYDIFGGDLNLNP